MNANSKQCYPKITLSPTGGTPLSTVLNMFGGLSEFDLIDPLCKAERTQAFIAALDSRAQVDKHQCLAIPTETILQEIRELGIAEGYMLGPIGKGCENVAQTAKALVDGLGFFETAGVRCSSTAIESF
mmetsp:Transcript_22839/g.55050  ORF Transcript_22839/g.55050 Transcript_22839/m.55050 type:complete len:128 (-) Transcript_22839:1105-1488(-)